MFYYKILFKTYNLQLLKMIIITKTILNINYKYN